MVEGIVEGCVRCMLYAVRFVQGSKVDQIFFADSSSDKKLKFNTEEAHLMASSPGVLSMCGGMMRTGVCCVPNCCKWVEMTLNVLIYTLFSVLNSFSLKSFIKLIRFWDQG